MIDRDEIIEKTCTSKKAYRGMEAAGRAAKKAKAERGTELRIYSCEFCGGYHLTKRSLEELARV